MTTSAHTNNATALENLPEYTYAPLSDPARNIRVIELLPGKPDDEVRIRIKEVTLEGPKVQEHSGRLSLEELESTIPHDIDCDVHQITGDRFLFYSKNNDDGSKTRIHPCPNFDKSKYFFPEPVRYGEPKFEALSYVWGTEPDEAFVVVEASTSGMSSTGLSATASGGISMLRIRPNLSLILCSLRQEGESRTLWIDAICINQRDDAERGVQVRQMKDIYSLAYRVVIWMGLASEIFDTRRAIENIVYMSRQIEVTTDRWKLKSPDASEDRSEKWSLSGWNLPFTTSEFEGIYDLLKRDWVYRLWLVQEAHLANRNAMMQWGNHCVAVLEILKAVHCLESKHRLPLAGLRDAASNLEVTLSIQHGSSLPHLLLKSVNRKCSDPRDRVYGLLGMAPPKVARLMKPDYSATSAVRDVYRDSFLAHLKVTQRIEMFMDPVPNPSPSWPSCVTDWDATVVTPRLASYQFCSGCSSAHYLYHAPDSLHLLGVRAAVVSWVEEQKETKGVYDVKLRIDDLLEHCQAEPATLYVVGGSMRDAVAWTARRGWCEEFIGGNYSPTLGKIWDTIMNGQPMASTNDVERLTYDEHQIVEICNTRRFIHTSEGYIGLCPGSVEKGDVIAALLGCPSLIVLRPSVNRDVGYFQYLGICFVPGLTDCTPFLGSLPSPWVTRKPWGYGGRYEFAFFNSETGEATKEDPRLEPLDETDWEYMDHEPCADDPEFFDYFRNIKTGEVMNSDPRLLPDNLRRKGVNLENFILK